MSYTFPDGETLARYLALLQRVLVQARFRAYETDPRLAELLDTVHNIPDLLCRWPDMNESWVLDDLERYERKYHGGPPAFSRILVDGHPANWQLVWKPAPPDET